MRSREFRRVLSGVLRFLRDVILIELLLLLLAGIVWAVSGGRSFAEYSRAVTCGGGLAIFLGAIGLRGGMSIGRDTPYQMSESASDASVWERGQQRLQHTYQGTGFLLLMTLVGLLAVTVGLLLGLATGTPLSQ
jgi:hypothetical protein